ncbi:MAG TPA: NAD-dependent DNA ligase LigA [Sedimentibacter sp.]|jgi:DNA ligase (NAD+)|nr:NAD-dependent DNA ligase LigA [Sedimentibacter sp.]NLA14505.1 NAD-dependent DNA ligase LigA [Tissierellia bacterium]HOA19940.1 NAD-dependent DNA ligase LigA [Sedimentibacter sp.]HOG62965.1 NAD-dependent DNA ligase LigA [Sedimentibacter sp.]HPB79211.1 NAD-dependent DNA ligase LigA [Sedimentibacter sp.]
MDKKLLLMKEKIRLLNEANKAYYQEDREIMSNYEYDKLYDELKKMEEETGIVLSNSPTIRVGYELLSNLPEERHEKVMLSLDKTKEVTALKDWLGEKTGALSWKLDGLTIVMTYEGGRLVKAVTRGNGEVGEVVTNNAKVFTNIPLSIAYKGSLVLRGEAVISYSDFYKINETIPEAAGKYKNPRNLCSGSVRQLNNRITAERNVGFYAFSVVKADEVDFKNSRIEQLLWLNSQGFSIVEFKKVTQENIEETVNWFEENIRENDLPSDGLVLTYDDIKYGESLGSTAKFPKDSIAFKWSDEIKETTLLEIEWSASRTGLINPIAVFEPVELEGTTVSRASVHNLSIMEDLELGIGDRINVYKANMIIPQISDNLTRSNNIEIPEHCPVCGGETSIKNDNDIKTLYCINDECLAKQIKSFTHFVSRDALNIKGLSEATIEKLIAKGLIKELADIFHIERYKDIITEMEGFGEKSFNNLVNSVNKARKTTAARLLYSFGITNIGLSNAKLISRKFGDDWEKIQNAKYEELIEISGIGEVMAKNYVKFFSDEKKKVIVEDVLKEVEIETSSKTSSTQIFENYNFAITGAVEHFKNRDELKAAIEERGGKVTSSVTSKTNYLINNDNLSNSSKNKKAKELGIEIITEEQFLKWMNTGVR